ncbi:hypothetical protein BDQ12DRAFT_690311 [Crucibulum laeve]|uniref:Uncharacterized protein n=1 Tax=Crucibulum laeve TaxID=68775 RepID=A0A5C3LMW6_9AGAR|nr:hypothetical protein BDQ12DRAFT_690311 [Crucibulum laeve]
MQLMNAMKAFTLLFISMLTLVAGTPLSLDTRDVFVPPVLYPHTGTVWKILARHNVTWDVSNPPAQITNRFGAIYLRKDGLIDLDHPLAEGFDILLGRIEVEVPKVKPRNDYQIVLFGDSGNWSGTFTIKK